MIDYSIHMLGELQKLEEMSLEYKGELKYLSKRIRHDIWDVNNAENTEKLAKLLHTINLTYEITFRYIDFFDLSCIIEYVRLLAKYCIFICPNLDADYYNRLIDDIQMENARLIIEEQWKDINLSEDGLKSFKEIFDDIFTQCINGNREKFFHELKDTDVLCRVVNDKYPINRDRFIPWEAKTNNRWNPPGRAFLYLSFSEKLQEYSKDLTLNEYICLEEYRAKKGSKYFFCDFKPVKKGVILDLSYNDVTFRQLKGIVDTYQNELESKMIEEIMSDPKTIEKYKNNKKKLRKKVRKLQLKYPVDGGVIEESYAKQYLKMICSCIYKKVDEKDEAKKEDAYKSFHALALYLEEKGVTGIIYPCTRTKEVIGKNLVLFNKNDAEPIESSIREFDY